MFADDPAFTSNVIEDSVPVPRYVGPYIHSDVQVVYWKARISGANASWSATRLFHVKSRPLPANDFVVPAGSGYSAITSRLREAMAACPNPPTVEKLCRLRFEPGTYVIGQHDAPVGDAVLDVHDVANFHVDGEGSTFIVSDPGISFVHVRGSDHVTVSALTVRFETTTGEPVGHTAGRVTGIDVSNKKILFEVLPGHLPLDSPLVANANDRTWGYLTDPEVPGRIKTKVPGTGASKSVPDFFIFSPGHEEKVGANAFWITLDGSQAHYVDFVNVGDVMVKTASYGPGSYQALAALKALNSNDITFLDLKIYTAPGRGFFGSRANDTKFLGVKLLLQTMPTRRYATSPGDAIIGSAYPIGHWVEGCVFEGVMDDIIAENSLPVYASAVDFIQRTLTFRGAKDRLDAGDQVTYYDPGRNVAAGPFRIEQACLANPCVVTVSGPLEQVDANNIWPKGTNTGRFFVEKEQGQYAYYRGNIFRNSRHLGVNLSLRDAAVESNAFEGLGECAVYASPSVGVWDNGWRLRGFLFKDNVVASCGLGIEAPYRPSIHLGVPVVKGVQATGSNVHSRIRVVGNSITDWEGAAIEVFNASGVEIRNNTISDEQKSAFASPAPHYPIYLKYDDGVVVRSNVVTDVRMMGDSGQVVKAVSVGGLDVLDNEWVTTVVHFADGYESESSAEPGASFTSVDTAVDVAGQFLEATSTAIGANRTYFPTRLGSSAPNLTVGWSATVTIPDTAWIGIGFQESDVDNGFFAGSNDNTGPWVVLAPTAATIQGGVWTTGSISRFADVWAPGQSHRVEFCYHPATRTADLWSDGRPLGLGLPIQHLDASGQLADPVMKHVQIQFFGTGVGNGHVDDFKVVTLPISVE
ncbi:MAG: right-handed parallel beta-helix repeat-containing protein [Deltaproteobacteria bacterium]|nr:right-handed parallel beta-helix repeat-containing protein [Deltaproteobacteria bacterium]